MAVELHLPDLPEVPLKVGLSPLADSVRRVRVPWHLRLRETLANYLPIVLMVLLALATAWLVRNTPGAPADPARESARLEPDYTMTGFAIERFDASGRLVLRLEGERLRHFPRDDRIEVDTVRIRSIAPDGRVTLATARQALGTGDGSELRLVGGAEVVIDSAGAAPITMRGEFLHAFLDAERVKSHLPVTVVQGAATLRAGGLAYDHAVQRLDLLPPLRAVFPPRGRGPAPGPRASSGAGALR